MLRLRLLARSVATPCKLFDWHVRYLDICLAFSALTLLVGGRKGIRPVLVWYVSGLARCRLACGLAETVKIQIGFYLSGAGSPG